MAVRHSPQRRAGRAAPALADGGPAHRPAGRAACRARRPAPAARTRAPRPGAAPPAPPALAPPEPRDRELTALRSHAGPSNAEIAKVIGASESAAGTRLHRAVT